MPFLSFLTGIEYLGQFKDTNTFVVNIDFLLAVALATGSGGRVHHDLLHELM